MKEEDARVNKGGVESAREVFALWGMDLALGLGIPGTSFDFASGGPLGRSCLIDSASWGAVFDDEDTLLESCTCIWNHQLST